VAMSDLDDRAVTTIYEALCSLSERIETGLAEAREADAGFDGGEFSGPAHDEMDAEAWERIERINAASDVLGDTMAARHVTDISAPEGSTDYAPCSFCGTPTYDRAANYVEGRLVCLPCRTSRERVEAEPEYDPAEDADSEVVACPPEEPITVAPTHGESPGKPLVAFDPTGPAAFPPMRCEMCGEILHEDDELGEFVENDNVDEAQNGRHVIAHSQCGLDRGLPTA